MKESAKIFVKAFLAAFIFLVLFAANPGFAYALELAPQAHFADTTLTPNTSSTPPANNTNLTGATQGSSVTTPNPNLPFVIPTQTPISSLTPTTTVPPGSCVVSTLTPVEAKGILDITHNGFNAKAITDGNDTNNSKGIRDLGGVDLIGKDTGGKEAVKVSAPTIAVNANRFSFLAGTKFDGPFGIGLILSDTLRVGKCDYPANLQALCKIYGDGLSVRTSGNSFKSDLVNAFASAKSAFTGTNKSLAENSLSPSDYNKLRSNYLDTNSNDFTTGSFASGAQITNSILVNKYTARNSTTCNNSSCIISTYSAFDKYFNAWLTTDMVVSSIGPTLLHKADKLLTKASKSFADGSLPGKFGLSIPQKLKDQLIPPGALFPSARFSRYNALIKEEGIAEVFKPLTIEGKLFSSGAGGAIDKMLAPDSPIWKFDTEKRKAFYAAVEHLRAYTHLNAESFASSKQIYADEIEGLKLIADPALKSAAEKAAKLTYAQNVSKYFNEWDDTVFLDSPAWLKDKENLLSMGGYAVRKNGIAIEGQGYVDVATSEPFNFKRVLEQFRDKGTWSEWAGKNEASTFEALPDGSLKLYKLEPSFPIANNVSLQDLKYHLAKVGPGTYSIALPDGKLMPLSQDTINYIESNPLLPGHVNILKSQYAPATSLTPEDFANRITDARIVGRANTATRNMDDLHNALLQKDYAPRAYTSLLDMQYAKEGDMFTNYFKNPVTGLYKGVVLPIGYWELKQGFGNITGNKQYSAFLLPDTWTTFNISQGQDVIYKDSFIDFFANEGSDQGDMFKRTFNNALLVWPKAVDMLASTNTFTKEMLSKVSGGFFSGSATRDTVADIAFYSHNENCADCSGGFDYKNGNFILDGFKSSIGMQAFIVEAKTPDEQKKDGSLLISYTHHSDLGGQTGASTGYPINLAEAASKDATVDTTGATCDAVLRKWYLGWAGAGAAGVAGGIENLAYLAGFGPGLVASILQQLTIGRELQDCVDDVEGYYVHFYSPPSADAAKGKSKEILSNETLTSTFSDMSTKLDSFVKDKTTVTTDSAAAPKTPVQQSLDSLKNQFNNFADQAKKSNILQASVELMPPSQGTLQGKDVFYVWFKESMTPSSYRTTGKTVLSDGNQSVEINYAEGTLKVNGNTVLGPDKADHTRLSTMDNKIPATVVPMTLNKVSAPMNENTVFELNTYGEVRVLNAQVLDCIQRAVKDQSGITYTGDELTQAFGKLSAINTDSYGSVFARDNSIYLEGTAARVSGSPSSKFIINGFWQTKLIDGNASRDSGKFVGMNFANGVIVLKPETNELVVWLRQHKDAVLTNKDVKGLNATLSSIQDPTTGCDNPAIKLNAVPYVNDDLGAQKVTNFNTSMDLLGPFTQFTTDKRIYEFYTKKDPATGECKNYFRVRDKATGNIITDQEITSPITQAADGTISFKTADGKTQTLQFSAENGVPKLSYNGGVPETLVSAQGPKGSFWYDTATGQWYPENGLQIPSNQAFKDNGTWFAPDKNGNVVGTPENKMTFNLGSAGQSGFNLPSMPESIAGIVLFILAFLAVAYTMTMGRTSKTGFRKLKK